MFAANDPGGSFAFTSASPNKKISQQQQEKEKEAFSMFAASDSGSFALTSASQNKLSQAQRNALIFNMP